MISWIDKRLNLFELKVEWSESNNTSVVDFLTGNGPKTLSVFKTVESETTPSTLELMCHDAGKIGGADKMVAYVIRTSPDEVTTDNVAEMLQCGTVGNGGLTLQAFERVMKGLV